LGNISLGNDQTLAGKLLCQSLTMQVVGQVSAGIKFSKIMPEDVMVNGYLVQIRIPSAEIFSGPVLDSQATQVLDTETCFLTDVLGKEDPELETRLRTQAELQILSWAQQDPTLFAEANAGAIAAMTQIARSIVPANYQVIVTTKP
jgi:hypothetical protein